MTLKEESLAGDSPTAKYRQLELRNESSQQETNSLSHNQIKHPTTYKQVTLGLGGLRAQV